MSFQYVLASITEMLAHCKELLEYRNGYISINPRFDKLITSLPIAVETDEGVLAKDLFDAFRMSLMFWN